jgi:hypothetical protein
VSSAPDVVTQAELVDAQQEIPSKDSSDQLVPMLGLSLYPTGRIDSDEQVFGESSLQKLSQNSSDRLYK